MRLRFQKGDLIAIAAVLLLAALVFCLFLPKSDPGVRADIYQNGQLVRSVSLSEDTVFSVNFNYTNTVTVQNGKIAVTGSTCPGGDCVRCGWLDTAGRSIVCLPNALEIRIAGTSGDVDFVVG